MKVSGPYVCVSSINIKRRTQTKLRDKSIQSFFNRVLIFYVNRNQLIDIHVLRKGSITFAHKCINVVIWIDSAKK